MTTAAAGLRLCFIVLFGAMSLMHGPIMAYAGQPAEAGALPATKFNATGSDRQNHQHGTPAADHVQCNSFACFLAVEPIPALARPLRAVLFGKMTAERMRALDPILPQPDLPPPRLQS